LPQIKRLLVYLYSRGAWPLGAAPRILCLSPRRLQTDQRFPGIDSNKEGLQQNADRSFDIYVGPKAPNGKESNWLQSVPDKGWNTVLRLYGPLEPWFDKTWRPDDFELIEDES